MLRVSAMAAARLLLVLTIVVAMAGRARADRKADVRRAEQLFDEARARMEAKDFAAACPMLEESQLLDPGLGTQFNIALCYKGLGRLLDAVAMYRTAEAQARIAGDKRAQLARDELTALEPRLPRLVLRADGAPPGLTITIDGVAVPESALGVVTAHDPAAVTIVAEAPGQQRFTRVVTLREGVTEVVDVVLTPVRVATAPTTTTRTPRRSRRRLYGVLVGAAGLGLIGVGSGFGLLARSRWSDAQDGCDHGFCTPAGQDDADAARSAATVSTVSFIAGGVLLVGGVVLYLTAPRERSRALTLAPLVTREHAGLGVLGRF